MITKLRRMKAGGFSLVELMVVVAIIGILAAVAIPNFSKFQRRARASETKVALGSVFDAQKAFLAEWEDYSDSMAAIGYAFDGNRRTDVMISAAAGGGTTAATRYTAEAVAAAMSTLVANYGRVSGLCANAVFMPGCMNSPNLPANDGNVPGTAFALGAAGVAGTWTAAAATNVGSSTDEVWTMTHQKVFVQTGDGINAN